MKRLILGLTLLFFAGCAKITVLRTTEIDAIVSAKADSVIAVEKENLQTLQDEYKKYRLKYEDKLRKLEEKLDRILTNVDESNQRITAIMEKTGAISKHWENKAKQDSLVKVMEDNKRMNLYKTAQANYQSGSFESARDGFEEYLETYPEGEDREGALFGQAECYYALKDIEKAGELFTAFFQTYPESENAPQSLYKLALVMEAQKKEESMKLILKQLIERYPDSREAIKAQTME